MNRPALTRQPAPAAAAPQASEMQWQARWQVRLLGAVDAFDGVQRIERFPSRAVAALLARLALSPQRAHPREELVELLWPGVALAVGRNRLRQALSTLKSLLEPTGVPGTAVLQADRLSLRVVPGALACDALDFERAVRAGQWAQAQALDGGELMPGFYDEWIVDERQRLQALRDRLASAAPTSLLPSPLASTPTTAPTTAPTAAPTTALDAPRTTPLPSYLMRLFGADHAVARLRSVLRTQRLVTLLGPGGSGKTRLAVEVAQSLREAPPWQPEATALAFERLAFVSLVSCEDTAQMHAAMARALHLPVSAADPAQGLCTALAGQRVLLVLDNFERLVGAVPAQGVVAVTAVTEVTAVTAVGAVAAVGALVAALPQLHLLVTSRRSLGLDGEVSISMEPLALPAPDAGADVAGTNAAVALFVDRARAARADFHLHERNHGAVVKLVRALQGLPLAIELAACRVRSFAPAEMVKLLGAAQPDLADAAPRLASHLVPHQAPHQAPHHAPHLALLARGGPRAGHDARHASMNQVIAWSWRLLDAPAQRLLGALATFAGPASAQALAHMQGQPVALIAARLDDLAGHSLLRVMHGEPARFGLMEPVREFVRVQQSQAEHDQQLALLRRWLLHWAAALGATPAPAQVDAEMAAVHQVLASAATHPFDAIHLALALRAQWDAEGLSAALQTALEHALEQVGETLGTRRSEAHELLSYLRFESGFVAAALAHADAALASAGQEPRLRARALVRRAWVALASSRHEGDVAPGQARLQAWLQEAMALALACGDREAQARALHQMAVMESQLNDHWVQAEALLARAQALWQALGDRRKAHARLRNRAQCWVQMGRQAQAQESYELCERVAREDGDWVGQIDCLLSLSSLLCQQRQWQAALDVDRRCVALCWQRWHRHGLAYALWNPPRSLARLRRPEAAMRLMAFAASFWQANFGALARGDRLVMRRVRGLVRAQLGVARAEALWAEGAAMNIAQAVALAQQN